MDNIEQIKDALQDRVLRRVSEATGINTVTLGQIKSGKKTRISKTTRRLLVEYLGLSKDD